MSITSDQWAQFYHGGEAPDSTSLAHRASNAPSKPSTPRRRSRASRKAPTTLLNASTANFRDLVQQFTGFHAAGTSLALAAHKGPVNLSFGQAGDDLQHRASVMVPFSDSGHVQYRQPQLEQQFAYQSENRSIEVEGSGPSKPTSMASEYMEIQTLMDEELNYDLLEFSSNGSGSGNGNYGGCY